MRMVPIAYERNHNRLSTESQQLLQAQQDFPGSCCAQCNGIYVVLTFVLVAAQVSYWLGLWK